MPSVIGAEFSLDTIDKLRKRGLDIHETDEDGMNALKLALYQGSDREIIEGLLERGISDNFDIKGQSIPAYLQEVGREDLLELFTARDLEPRQHKIGFKV